MKLNVNVELTQFDGAPLEVQNTSVVLCDACTAKWEAAKKPLTLRLAITRALTALTQKTQALDGQKKFERGELASKIYQDDEPSLSADDIILIRDAVDDHDGPLVVFRVRQLLEAVQED